MSYTLLPGINAVLNAIAAVLLVIAYLHAKNGRIESHFKTIYGCLFVSGLFLISYVSYHTLRQMDQGVGHTVFPLDGWIKTVYYTILIPHVILAASLVPLVLLTVFRGRKAHQLKSEPYQSRHRNLARITLPIWLFVSVSGVVVYLMLYQLPIWI